MELEVAVFVAVNVGVLPVLDVISVAEAVPAKAVRAAAATESNPRILLNFISSPP
jgi:hypothetical protein